MANNTFKIVAEWSLPNGSIGQNILYAEIAGGDSADPQTLVDDVAIEVERIFSPWLGAVTQNGALSRALVYAFDVATGLSTPVGTGVINSAGLASGNSCPGGVATKVNLFVAGRSRPAGMYLPTPAAALLTATGSMSASTVIGALAVGTDATAVSALTTNGETYTPLYFSEKDGIMVSLVNASIQVDTTYDYMRSRKAGNGI